MERNPSNADIGQLNVKRILIILSSGIAKVPNSARLGVPPGLKKWCEGPGLLLCR